MAKRRSYTTIGGGGSPRANWWRQTLGTDYYYRGQGYSEELQAWITAVESGGNTAPSATVLSALDTFLATSLETGTILSRMKTGYIFHAGSKGAAKINLKDPATYPLTESGTVTWSEGNGVKSASSSYFNQPFKSDEYAGIESDLTVVQYVSESSTTAAFITSHGVRTRSDVNSIFHLMPMRSVGAGRAYCFDDSTFLGFTSNSHKGLYVQLNDGENAIVYKDGTKSSTAVTPDAPNISQNRFILAQNIHTTGGIGPLSYYVRYVACDFLFDKFSDADESAFRTAFNTYKTAVSLP